MTDGSYIMKKNFAKEPAGERQRYVVGTRQVSVCVQSFSMSDDPFVGLPSNFGYFGFTPQIEEFVKVNTQGHLALGDCRGVKELYGSEGGKTAIICGSSRSILKAKELIPDKGTPGHENLVVFALNAAGVALGAEKVDYLFALDYSSRIEWYPESLRHLPIVMSFNCPDLIGEFFKERYYFASPVREDAAMREKFGFLDVGHIASYSAAHMAFKMGVKRIVWVGHEFSYTPDDGRLWNHFNDPLTMDWLARHEINYAPDFKGNPVSTCERLMHNMRIVAAISYMCAEQGIEVINATGQGTLGIQQEPEGEESAGVYTMDLNQALERIANADLREEACPAGNQVHDQHGAECLASA